MITQIGKYNVIQFVTCCGTARYIVKDNAGNMVVDIYHDYGKGVTFVGMQDKKCRIHWSAKEEYIGQQMLFKLVYAADRRYRQR